MKILFTSVFLLTYAFAASCMDTSEKPASEKDRRTVTATQQQEGSTVELRVGDGLRVELEAQPGTGYSWQVVTLDETRLRPVGSTRFEAPDQGKAGQAERQILEFEAIAEGNSVLELHYKRSWEKTSPSVTYRLKIRII